MSEKQKQALIELLTSLLVLAVYWVSLQPEWKLQMYLAVIKRLFRRREPVKLSPEHRAMLEKFRKEISAWEHEQRRTGGNHDMR